MPQQGLIFWLSFLKMAYDLNRIVSLPLNLHLYMRNLFFSFYGIISFFQLSFAQVQPSKALAFYTQPNEKCYLVAQNAGTTSCYRYTETGDWIDNFVIEIAGNFVANSLVANPKDNFFYLGGTLQASENGFKKGMILCFDKENGKIKWQKQVGGDRGDEVQEVKVNEEGDVYYCGTTNSLGNGKKDILVGKIDKEGKPIWEKSYGWENEEEGFAISLRKDNSLLIGGNTLSRGAGKSDMLVLNINTEGDLLWQRVYGKSANDKLYAMTETDDEGIILAGSSDENGMQDGKIYFLDKAGKVLSSQVKNGVESNYFNSLIAKDGTIISVSNLVKNQEAHITKWNSKGELIHNQVQKGIFLAAISTDAQYIAGRELSQNQFFVSKIDEIKPIDVLAAINKAKVETTIPANSIAEARDMESVTTSEESQHEEVEKQPEVSAENTEIIDKEDITSINTLIDTNKIAPQLFLFSLGIEGFKEPTWENLLGDYDAKRIHDFFVTENALSFGSVKPFLFLNQDAKAKNVKSTLINIQQKAKTQDLSIFYFNTQHFYPDSAGNIYLLNTESNSEIDKASSLNLSQLLNVINQIEGNKMVILDIFHAGIKPEQQLNAEAQQDLFNNFEQVHFLFASSATELSQQSLQTKGGYFAYSLLEGLKGKANYNHDDTISFDELNLYVSEAVKELSHDEQHPFGGGQMQATIPILKIK